MTSNIGSEIIGMLRNNKTIINLEFFQNKDFEDRTGKERKEENSRYKSVGLTIYQIEDIKKRLKENYDAYVKMRTDEWRERKRMTSNYQDNVDTQNIVESQKTIEETRKKEKEDIEMLYINNFNENVKAMEEEFNRQVNEYFAETKAAKGSKKGKKKGKKKK